MLDYTRNNKNKILDILSKVIVNMLVIVMATRVFKNINVDGIFYVFIVSILLMLFNKSVKPILNIIMLPINLFTLGLTYPFVNVIILKLISFILGEHFILTGWISAFFISVFMSMMTIIVDFFIGKEINCCKWKNYDV